MTKLRARIQTFFANLTPAQALFLLSPTLGELVSSYLSPLEFFNPLIFIITVFPYGCGALIVRELVVRNGKGWVSTLLLGLAFGLFFEGIVTRVIFNPNWEDLGALGEYGRYYSFNWTLAEGVIHFHAVLSIFAAILLAEIIYPEHRHESWISAKTLRRCMIVLPAWTLVIGIFVPYIPPLPGIVAVITITATLIWIALHIPTHPFQLRPKHLPRPWVFGLLGAVNMTFLMVSVYIIPEMKSPPPMPLMFAAVIVMDIISFSLLLRWSGSGQGWEDHHRLALVIGILAFFIVFGFAQDLFALFGIADEPDAAFAGRSIVSIITVVQLRKLWFRIPKGVQNAEIASTMA